MDLIAEDLLAGHRPLVRRYLATRLRDQSAVDEATQETLVRALVGRSRLREPDRLEAWLIGIARRVSAERLREDRRAAPAGSAEDLLPDAAAPDCPERALIAARLEAELTERIAELSPERRAALSLRAAGCDYHEIASTLGWSIAKVKNELHRARARLRAAAALSFSALIASWAISASGPPAPRPRSPEVSAEIPVCFESGIGGVAAAESRYRACMLHSPSEPWAPACFE